MILHTLNEKTKLISLQTVDEVGAKDMKSLLEKKKMPVTSIFVYFLHFLPFDRQTLCFELICCSMFYVINFNLYKV